MSWNLHDEEELMVLEQRLLEGMPPVASTAIALIAALREARAALAETRRDLHEARTDVRDLLKLRETNERLTRERDEWKAKAEWHEQAETALDEARAQLAKVMEELKFVASRLELAKGLEGDIGQQLAKVTEERDRLRGLLVRVETYAREDRAVTPGVTRLRRVLDEVRAALSQGTGPAPAEQLVVDGRVYTKHGSGWSGGSGGPVKIIPSRHCDYCNGNGHDPHYDQACPRCLFAEDAPADTKTEGERPSYYDIPWPEDERGERDSVSDDEYLSHTLYNIAREGERDE